MIEFHETQDVGEGERALARVYVGALAPRLFALADRFIVHSAHDRELVTGRFRIPESRIETIPHALYEHHRGSPRERATMACAASTCGVIRPFKGVEDLVRAFDLLSDSTRSATS